MPAPVPGEPARSWLRGLPLLRSTTPPFDPASADPDPLRLFWDWIVEAAQAGEPEPQAVVLSTVDAGGRPDARTMSLKDLDAGAFWVAGGATSPKGRQLDLSPVAALVFYWPSRGRQVRVRGQVLSGTPERTARDFRERGEAARTASLHARQSDPVEATMDVQAEIDEVKDLITADPAMVAPTWRTWGVRASRVEFWQSHPARRHLRLRYDERPDGRGYTQTLLWP